MVCVVGVAPVLGDGGVTPAEGASTAGDAAPSGTGESGEFVTDELVTGASEAGDAAETGSSGKESCTSDTWWSSTVRFCEQVSACDSSAQDTNTHGAGEEAVRVGDTRTEGEAEIPGPAERGVDLGCKHRVRRYTWGAGKEKSDAQEVKLRVSA